MRPILVALTLLAALPLNAEPAVQARWIGYDTACAEMDNAVISLSHPAVRRFEVRATHPAYLAGREGDSMAPDFSHCVFPDEPIWDRPDTFEKVLYEDDRILLKGWRMPKSWRPEEPDFVIGDTRFKGVNLTQLHVKLDGVPIEVLVLYPVDGYWRPRPLPPVGRDLTGFGSSVLIGPVEVDRRPLVKLREVTFDPATLTYHLDFAAGGGGAVRVVSAGRDATRLEVTLDEAVPGGPFAVLSSMHVAPDNADVSRLSVRAPGDALWSSRPIAGFEAATGAEFAFGRDLPSRHNYSAPDVTFGPFRE